MPQAAHDDAAMFINAALSANELRHQVYRTFAMSDAAAAHEATESMSHVGKVLLTTD